MKTCMRYAHGVLFATMSLVTACSPDRAKPGGVPSADAGGQGGTDAGTAGTGGGGGTDAGGCGVTDGSGAKSPIAEIVVGTMEQAFACARKADGTVWCWGANSLGELGNGTTTFSSTPVQVASLGAGVLDIAAFAAEDMLSSAVVCAVAREGTVWCWGGSAVQNATPVQITALGSGAVEVAVSLSDVCARKSDGSVSCSSHGYLSGFPSWDGPVPGASPSRSIVSGLTDTCSVRSDGTVYCWDSASGTGGEAAEYGSDVDQLSMASWYMDWSLVSYNAPCARKNDGSLWCSGRQGFAQVTSLGDSVARVSAGIGRICAVKTDGTLWCWGYNADGWLGAGVNASDAPVQIAWLGSGVIDVAASAGMTCALKTDGTVWCGRSCVTADGGKTTCVPPTAPVEFDCR